MIALNYRKPGVSFEDYDAYWSGKHYHAFSNLKIVQENLLKYEQVSDSTTNPVQNRLLYVVALYICVYCIANGVYMCILRKPAIAVSFEHQNAAGVQGGRLRDYELRWDCYLRSRKLCEDQGRF